jgi:hypothetical protein
MSSRSRFSSSLFLVQGKVSIPLVQVPPVRHGVAMHAQEFGDIEKRFALLSQPNRLLSQVFLGLNFEVTGIGREGHRLELE